MPIIDDEGSGLSFDAFAGPGNGVGQIIDDSPESPEVSLPRRIAATGARVLTPLVGTAIGAGAGALAGIPTGPGAVAGLGAGGIAGQAIGSGLGEAIAERIEGRPVSPAEVLTETALGAIPLPGSRPARTLAGQIAKRAAAGALLAGAGEVPRSYARGEGMPSLGRVAESAAFGGAFTGAVGAGEHLLLNRRGLAPIDYPIPTDPDPGLGVGQIIEDQIPSASSTLDALRGPEPGPRVDPELAAALSTGEPPVRFDPSKYQPAPEPPPRPPVAPLETAPIVPDEPPPPPRRPPSMPPAAAELPPVQPQPVASALEPTRPIQPAPPPPPDLERGGVVGYATDAVPGALPVYRVRTDAIGVDPERFQFKGNVDPTTGEVGHMVDTARWNPALADNISLWRDPETGQSWVVNGHNRLGRARRGGIAEINAIFLDVPTVEEARALGAIQNIADNNGTPIDVAKLFRDGGVTPEQLIEFGVPRRSPLFRQGFGISRLNDALFRKAVIGELTPERGALIGNELPNHADQDAIIKLLSQREGEITDRQLAAVISRAKAAAVADVTVNGRQTAFAGMDEPTTRNLAVEEGILSEYVTSHLSKTRSSLGYVSQESRQDTLAAAGNRIDTERSRALSDRAAEQLRQFEVESIRPSTPIGQALRTAATRLANGEPETALKRELLATVQRETDAAYNRTVEPRAPSSGQNGDSLPGTAIGAEPSAAELEAAGQSSFLTPLRNERGGVASDLLTGGLNRLFGRGRTEPPSRPVVEPDARGARPLSDQPSLTDLSTTEPGTAAGPPPARRFYEGDLFPGPITEVERGRLSARNRDRMAPSLLDAINSSDDLATFKNDLALENRNAVEYARRGRVSIAEQEAMAEPIVRELAARVGADPATFAESIRARGEAVNAESMRALLRVSDTVAADFWGAARDVAKNPNSELHQTRLLKAMEIYRGVLLQEAGAAAEAGRTLNTLRSAQGVRGEGRKAFDAAVRAAGGKDRLHEIAMLAARLNPDDPQQLSLFLRNVVQPTFGQKVYEAWLAALLSGPRTHVVNMLSNTAFLLQRLPERVIAGAIDAGRVGMFGGERQRYAGEAVADLRGIAAPFRVGARQFVHNLPAADADVFAWFNGVRAAVKAGARAMATSPISSTRLEETAPAIGGRLGKFIRSPLRALELEDEFFKSAAFYGDLYAQAYRKAAQEGHAGEALNMRMAEILANPDNRLWEHAKNEAVFRTFQDKPGPVTQAVINLRERGAPYGLKYIIPFVRTPVNLAKRGLEQTPLGLLKLIRDRGIRGTMTNGEATDFAARSAIGSMITAAVVGMAAAGDITGGGPSDPDRMRALRATGWQPYSVKIGNEWISYGRIDPLAVTMGLAADGVEAWDMIDSEDFASKMALLVGNNLANKTYMTGLADLIDAYSDPDRYGQNWKQKLAGTLVPTIVAQTAKAADGTVRRPESVMETWQSRLPGQTDNVKPIRDIWGEPVVQPGSFGWRLLSPFQRSDIRDDPASVEVQRLNIAPSSPRRQLGIGIRGYTGSIDLNSSEYDRYVEKSGQTAYRMVTRLVQSDVYQRLPDAEKEARILEAFTEAREAVRRQIRPDVLARAKQDGELAANARVSRPRVRRPRVGIVELPR